MHGSCQYILVISAAPWLYRLSKPLVELEPTLQIFLISYLIVGMESWREVVSDSEVGRHHVLNYIPHLGFSHSL